MEIIQKKHSNRLTFTFNDGGLNYANKDCTGSGDIDVQYATLPSEDGSVDTRLIPRACASRRSGRICPRSRCQAAQAG